MVERAGSGRARRRVGALVAAVAVLALTVGCTKPGAWTALDPPARGGRVPGFAPRWIECGGPAACVALGPAGPGERNAAAWDGTTWRLIAAPPLPQLDAFACASPTWCVAFGQQKQAVWDGSRWGAATAYTDPTGQLLPDGDLSCPAERLCYAPNLFQSVAPGPALWRWDGSSWSPVAGSETVGALTSVSCSAVDTCLATTRPAGVVRWHDGVFTPVALRGPAALIDAIDCPTATRCVLSGAVPVASGVHPAAAVWSGGDVEVVDLRAGDPGFEPWNEAGLFSLACAGPSLCLANAPGGRGAAFDGTTWRPVPEPQSWLEAVGCAPGGPCFGAGHNGLARWDATAWVTLDHPVGGEPGEPVAGFTDVSCPAPASCIAVGTYRDGARTRVLAESWSGGRWTVLPDLPVAAEGQPGDPRVDCAAPTSCAATVPVSVGGSTEPLLATWNGTDWTVIPAPWAAAGPDPVVDDVACGGPASCLAVGSVAGDATEYPPRRLFAAGWDGAAWTPRPVPAASEVVLAFGPTPVRLSCTGPTFCVRLSGRALFGMFGPNYANWLHVWDGTAWTPMSDPFFLNGRDTAVATDIDCTAPDACVVGGEGSITAPRAIGPVVATWNGAGWTRTQLPMDGGSTTAAMMSLSCAAAGRCLGLRDEVSGSRPSGPGLHGWAGPRPGWPPVASPNQPAGWAVRRGEVSCAGDACLVVGDTRSGQTTRPAAFTYRFDAAPAAAPAAG
jgi:hypothetical protein